MKANIISIIQLIYNVIFGQQIYFAADAVSSTWPHMDTIYSTMISNVRADTNGQTHNSYLINIVSNTFNKIKIIYPIQSIGSHIKCISIDWIAM